MAGISNHYDTLVWIKSIIDGLSLTGLTGGTVIQEVVTFEEGQVALPFISISPTGPERMNNDEGFNDRDDVEYRTLVAIFAKKETTTFEQRLAWRQSIRRRLNNTSNAALGMNYNVQVEPKDVVERHPSLEKKAFASGMIIRAFFQEPRT